LHRTAGADTKSFTLKALEELLELRFTGLREHQATLGGFPEMNFVELAEFADAIEMAEEIHNKEIIDGEGWENGGPNPSCILAANRFAALRF
jgi:hypothetical protein